MNILATQYTLSTKSFEIYLAGCNGNPHCDQCHNPESWDFENGEPYCESLFEKFKDKILMFDNIIDNIMIFGGEPLDQDLLMLQLLLSDLSVFNKQIWLFTRYDIMDVPQNILNMLDYLKCGRYIHELKCHNNIQYGIKLSTSNQNIYKKGTDF